MPLILAFTDLGNSDSVHALKEKLKETRFAPETDKYARLRLRGTFEELDRLTRQAQASGACMEFLDLLRLVKRAVAKFHDAAPPFSDGPDVKLSEEQQTMTVAPWAERPAAPGEQEKQALEASYRRTQVVDWDEIMQ